MAAFGLCASLNTGRNIYKKVIQETIVCRILYWCWIVRNSGLHNFHESITTPMHSDREKRRLNDLRLGVSSRRQHHHHHIAAGYGQCSEA